MLPCFWVTQQTHIMNTVRNSVKLIGHLGANPEVKEFDGGNKVARFTIATNESYKNKEGEKVENTEWHSVVAWGKTAELVGKFLEKGKEIAIEGKLTHRSYDDKDGNKRYTTEVVMNEFVMLGGKK